MGHNSGAAERAVTWLHLQAVSVRPTADDLGMARPSRSPLHKNWIVKPVKCYGHMRVALTILAQECPRQQHHSHVHVQNCTHMFETLSERKYQQWKSRSTWRWKRTNVMMAPLSSHGPKANVTIPDTYAANTCVTTGAEADQPAQHKFANYASLASPWLSSWFRRSADTRAKNQGKRHFCFNACPSVYNRWMRSLSTMQWRMRQTWRVEITMGSNFVTAGQIFKKMLKRKTRPFSTLC